MDLFSNDYNILPFALPKSEGYDYKWNSSINMFEINIPNGKVFYNLNFFDKTISDFYFKYLLENKNGLDVFKTDWRLYEKENLNQINFLKIGRAHV
jgi:hypothetical protein